MNQPQTLLAIARTGLPVLLCLPLCSAALADEAAFLRCRLLPEPTVRLACYDAVAPAAAPSAAAAAPPAAAEQFGFEQRAVLAAAATIETTIPGRFLGWRAGDRITLANGQVWQISDDSQGYLDALNPKVTVRRGALGAFYLDFEGTRRSPKVKRVQ